MIEPVPAATRCASAAPRQPHRSSEVHGEDRLPRVGRHLSDRTVAAFAARGIVHQHGEATERVRRPRDQGGARLLVAQLGRDEVRATAGGFDRRDDVVTTGLVASGDAHGRALGREAGGDGATDPRRRSGDERSFSRQPHPSLLRRAEATGAAEVSRRGSSERFVGKQGEHFDTRRRREQRMLELRGERAVGGDRGPPVGPDPAHLVGAGRDHRLDRERRAGFEDAVRVGLVVVRDRRRGVELRARRRGRRTCARHRSPRLRACSWMARPISLMRPPGRAAAIPRHRHSRVTRTRRTASGSHSPTRNVSLWSPWTPSR